MTYVCPARLVKNELLKHQAILQKEAEQAFTRSDGHSGVRQKGEGWQAYLARRASAVSRERTAETTYRRLYDILHDQVHAVDADIADSLLLACGVYIDSETNIPTLPGSKRTAEEMVRLRKGDLPKHRLNHYVDVLLRWKHRVIYPDGYVESPVAEKTRTYRAKRKSNMQLATSKHSGDKKALRERMQAA